MTISTINRPKIIVFVTTSLDSRIALGPNLTLDNLNSIKLEESRFFNLLGDWKLFEEKIKEIYNPDAQMEGSNMIM